MLTYFNDTGLCVGNSQVTGEFPAQKAGETWKMVHDEHNVWAVVRAFLYIYIYSIYVFSLMCHNQIMAGCYNKIIMLFNPKIQRANIDLL